MKYFRLHMTFALAAFAAACQTRGPQIKAPREQTAATEFHHQPAKIIPWVYANRSWRGLDGQADVSIANQIGGGLGVLINSHIDAQWNGHKFFYYYIDFDASPQYVRKTAYPGTKEWTFSSYPGILFRTYTPFYVKMHFGFGVNLRYNQAYYDRWGVYGQMGFELYGITASALFIGHPGQLNWENEYRIGYMFAPVDWR